MQQQYGKKKTNWNRDETILALDLYFRCNGPNLGASGAANPEVIELSDFLKQLPIHDTPINPDSFPDYLVTEQYAAVPVPLLGEHFIT